MATPATVTSVETIQWPEVTVAGQKLTVKHTFKSRYLLSKWKISAPDVYRSMARAMAAVKDYVDAVMAAEEAKKNGEEVDVDAIRPPDDEPDFLARSVELFAVCVAHNFTDVGMEPPSVDYWSECIESVEKWRECVKALWVAMGKARAGNQPPTTPATMTEAGAIQ